MATAGKLLAQVDESVFGTIEPPAGVAAYDQQAGGEIGLVVFISTLLRVATVIAGVWVLFQFFLAGYQYITANGDTSAHTKVKDRLTMCIVGLAIIAGAYLAAGVIGLIFFGDATFILNPTIESPTAPVQ
jgi:hypothetical protein